MRTSPAHIPGLSHNDCVYPRAFITGADPGSAALAEMEAERSRWLQIIRLLETSSLHSCGG